jgi:hypothetical protein
LSSHAGKKKIKNSPRGSWHRPPTRKSVPFLKKIVPFFASSSKPRKKETEKRKKEKRKKKKKEMGLLL